MPCAAGGILVPTEGGVLPLTGQGVQAIVDLQSTEATRSSALSENGDALRFVEAVKAERDDTFQYVDAVKHSVSTKNSDLHAGCRVTWVLKV